MSKMRPKMQRNACAARWCRRDRLPAPLMPFCKTHAQFALDMGWTNPAKFDLVVLGLTRPDRLAEVYYKRGLLRRSMIARWWQRVRWE
jgi:hypothetical protein